MIFKNAFFSTTGIKEVYFGCYNERFGGNGTILPLNNGNFGAPAYPSFGKINR